MYRLAVLKPLNHVIDEFLRYLFLQPYAVVFVFHHHAVNIQSLCRALLFPDVDRFEKCIALNNLLTDFVLGLCSLVTWISFDDNLPVAKGIFVV